MVNSINKLSHKQCTGCMACENSCTKQAITVSYDRSGHLMPTVDEDLCADCGLCSCVCPVLNQTSSLESKTLTYAAWSENKAIRKRSSSGGIFAPLAVAMVKNGGYISGAVVEGCEVRHIVTNNIEDIQRIQGSKYQQGRLDNIYRKIVQLLKTGNKVLFSGAPCQAAAMRQYAKTFKVDNANLIIVDFFCGGFPSILPMHSLLNNCGFEADHIVSFRDKEKGWKAHGYRYCLKIADTDGNIHSFTDNNIVTRAFASHLVNRSSCMDCKFATASRVSDLTIGDYWGCCDFKEQEHEGISVLVLHNQALAGFISSVGLTLSPIKWNQFVRSNNRAIVGTAKAMKVHWLRHMYSFVFRFCSYTTICCFFGVGKHSNLLRRFNSVSITTVKMLDRILNNKKIDKHLKNL